jgi:hypothetical protein
MILKIDITKIAITLISILFSLMLFNSIIMICDADKIISKKSHYQIAQMK